MMALKIPGVGIIGPIFKPLITFGIQVSAVFDVTYGFDVKVCFTTRKKPQKEII